MTFLLAYLNVNYNFCLWFINMLIFYEYIWKRVYWRLCIIVTSILQQSQCKYPRSAKMRSAVPPDHHLSEWTLLGWVIFICTVLGSDRRSDCKVLKNVCQCHNHTKSYTASIWWNADLTLDSSAKMRAHIRSQFSISIP